MLRKSSSLVIIYKSNGGDNSNNKKDIWNKITTAVIELHDITTNLITGSCLTISNIVTILNIMKMMKIPMIYYRYIRIKF